MNHRVINNEYIYTTDGSVAVPIGKNLIEPTESQIFSLIGNIRRENVFKLCG